jgi:hypothetical protein
MTGVECPSLPLARLCRCRRHGGVRWGRHLRGRLALLSRVDRRREVQGDEDGDDPGDPAKRTGRLITAAEIEHESAQLPSRRHTHGRQHHDAAVDGANALQPGVIFHEQPYGGMAPP